MEEARIKANTERSRKALQDFKEKIGVPIAKKIAYKNIMREEWLDKEKTELKFTIKNNHIKKLMHAEDFAASIEYELSQRGVKRDEYEVFIQ
jgi:hypothetical protein